MKDCESLEKLIGELNSEIKHLKEEKRQLRQENNNLKNENTRIKERADIWEDAFAGGVRPRLDQAIETLQIERDQAQTELEAIKRTIDDVAKGVKHDERLQANNLRQAFASFEDEAGSNKTPIAARWVAYTYEIIDKVIVGSHNRNLNLQLEMADDIFKYHHLRMLYSLATIVGARILATTLINYLRAETNPHYICFNIIREFKSWGSVSPNVTNSLNLNWLKENVSKRIGSHAYFHETLTHAWNSKQCENIASYAEKESLSEETIKKYRSYLRKIENYAIMAPSDLVGDVIKDNN